MLYIRAHSLSRIQSQRGFSPFKHLKGRSSTYLCVTLVFWNRSCAENKCFFLKQKLFVTDAYGLKSHHEVWPWSLTDFSFSFYSQPSSYVCLFGISDENSKSCARFGSDLPLSFFGKSLGKSSSWSGFMWDAFKQHCNLDKKHYFLTENITLYENLSCTLFSHTVLCILWCLSQAHGVMICN